MGACRVKNEAALLGFNRLISLPERRQQTKIHLTILQLLSSLRIHTHTNFTSLHLGTHTRFTGDLRSPCYGIHIRVLRPLGLEMKRARSGKTQHQERLNSNIAVFISNPGKDQIMDILYLVEVIRACQSIDGSSSEEFS